MLSRILKLSISVLFFCVEFTLNRSRSLLGIRYPGSCVVLYYHAVGDQHRLRFARQMDFLVRYAKAVPASQMTPAKAGEHLAVVTFDDGFESVMMNAIPELERRNIPAALFVVADRVGQGPTWGKEQVQAAPDEKLMSSEQLRSLPASVEIGSHSLTHPNLRKIDKEQARSEIFESRRNLRRLLGTKVTIFSFPYGSFNTSLVEYCREAGYERVFTTLPYLAFTGSDHFVTGRVPVEPTDWDWEFRLKLQGAYRWLPYAFSLKGKLRAALSFGPRRPYKVDDSGRSGSYVPNGH